MVVQVHVDLSCGQLQLRSLDVPGGFNLEDSTVQFSILHAGIVARGRGAGFSLIRDNRRCSVVEPFYDRLAGEPETGFAGEQRDRGIAGRNSSRTMRGRAVSGAPVPWTQGRPPGGSSPPNLATIWIDSIIPRKTHPLPPDPPSATH